MFRTAMAEFSEMVVDVYWKKELATVVTAKLVFLG
jgi:hypothetical protein